jgi:hypothetical protein
MSVWGVLWAAFWVVYGLIALAAWRMFAGHLAWRMMASYKRSYPGLGSGLVGPSGEQWFGGLIGGLLAAAVWPLALIFFWWPVRVGAEKRGERDALLARITELERETNLR